MWNQLRAQKIPDTFQKREKEENEEEEGEEEEKGKNSEFESR